MAAPLTIVLVPEAPAETRAQVLAGVRRHNRLQTVPPNWAELTLLLQDGAGHVVGGLTGEFGWRWLHIDALWVEPEHRGLGYGTRLLARAEAEARARDCIGIYLDSIDFQAPDFYRRHGYEAFGVLEDFPPGSRQTYFQKRLRPGG
jgi:ribosomal protein S18 acetylase RimI-like enzyme